MYMYSSNLRSSIDDRILGMDMEKMRSFQRERQRELQRAPP